MAGLGEQQQAVPFVTHLPAALHVQDANSRCRYSKSERQRHAESSHLPDTVPTACLAVAATL